MAADFSLLLSDARLTDQRTFTCMVVAGANIVEYPVNIVVYSEYKLPCGKRIVDWNTALITSFVIFRRDAHRTEDFRQGRGTRDWQAHQGGCF